MTAIIEHESEQVRPANATERRPVVFIHGLWLVKIANRGHALTIDSGWRTVADTALAFVRRFV